MKLALILVFVISSPSIINPSNSANILFFFGYSTHSHRIFVWPLVEKLADLGHNVTFYQAIDPTIIKHKHPKVKEFYPKSLQFQIDSIEPKIIHDSIFMNVRIEKGRQGVLDIMWDMPRGTVEYCRHLMNNEEFHELLESNSFDLLIIDALFNECALGIAYKFGSKVILLSTFNVGILHSEIFGFFPETPWIPDLMTWSGDYPMGFYERFMNTISPPMISYTIMNSVNTELETILRTKLNIPDMPSMVELQQNLIDLILLNNHFGEEFPRALPPLYKSISGLHCSWAWNTKYSDKRTKIPENIEKFIDEAEDGFIYISFGSALRISDAPVETQEKFFTGLAMRKERIVWKWEGERPKSMPENVIISSWLPQQEILAKKPKIFITHGGLLGLHEAIIHAIPLIMFPVFAEQDYNSYRTQMFGRGIRLEIAEFSAKELDWAINEILTNEKYARNMKTISELFLDRPMSPLDEAVWWVNHTLRNDRNRTNLLKSKCSTGQYWFQRRGIDIWLSIFCLLLLFVLITFKTLCILVKVLFLKLIKPHFFKFKQN